MSLLSIDGLTLSIGDAPILRDVSLSVAEGEIVALTGESGSGKSMTALAAMALLPRRARATGQVKVAGHDMLALPESELSRIRGRDAGMVFQEPMTALNPVMTVGAQVAETVRVHGGPDPARTARETLDRVGLSAIAADRYPHELSGGQRQRVVAAIAIALRPRLLIADEPTTALDVTTQAQILDLLVGLTRDLRMGMLLITHDLAVVGRIADRLYVMSDGRVVEHGPTRRVMAAPREAYTRMLFDATTHVAALPAPAPGAPLLEVRDLTRSYAKPRTALLAAPGRHVAVDGVSLDVRAGERVGLVGESGCGKSTLARAILGLEEPQSGTITLGGAPVYTGHRPNPAVRRRIQVVFQDPFGSFDPRHRVGRLIAEPFHLSDRRIPRAERRAAVAETLTAVGLKPSDAHRYIHEFSGGQRQRIAIARALIVSPDLIVFDEAVSALDVSVRARILDLLAGLARDRGLAWLFISHDLSVVRGITDRVLVMKDGKIVEEGPTPRVFDAPGHPYTRSLIDAIPRLPARDEVPA